MNTLVEFEKELGLSAEQAARLLGYAGSTYYQYRRSGAMPLYARRHVEVVLRLPVHIRQNLISEHVDGNTL